MPRWNAFAQRWEHGAYGAYGEHGGPTPAYTPPVPGTAPYVVAPPVQDTASSGPGAAPNETVLPS
ncbi:hypothetical protein G3I42_07150, partial [Streptomyces sp. SID11385]|nr:hypothetical protein [Streptomyces sp. SID11385]